jgi:hypothetical protein
VLLLREAEQRLGVAERVARCIRDPRNPDLVSHTIADILRFRLLMIAAGYEDCNDASSLRSDPVFKMALDVAPSDREFALQWKISRFENLPDARTLLRMGRVLVDLSCASFQSVPKRIVLDIDDTFDGVHGGQQLRLFDAHHDEYDFQPIVVFDGSGLFVSAMLRPAKRPSGKEAERFLRRTLPLHPRAFQLARRAVRHAAPAPHKNRRPRRRAEKPDQGRSRKAGKGAAQSGSLMA